MCVWTCVCVVSGGVLHCRKGDSHCTKSSLHYTSMYTHTTTTTKAFQSNTCLPGDNRNLLFTISYLGHMGFRSTRISCASAACLFQCVPVPPTSFLLRDRQQTMTVTVVGFQSNQSMRLIDNLYFPNKADPARNKTARCCASTMSLFLLLHSLNCTLVIRDTWLEGWLVCGGNGPI